MASLSLSTISQASSYGPDGNGIYSGFTLKDMVYTHVLVSFSATNQHDKPMKEVIAGLADFFNRTPFNVSIAETAAAIGSDNPRRVADLINAGFRGEDFARSVTAACAAAGPLLPHEQGTNSMTTVFSVMAVLATLAVGLRIWSREVLIMRLMTHDWFMIAGYFFALSYGIIAVIHASILLPAITLWDMTWSSYAQVQSYQTIMSIIYPLPIFFVKASLLLFYLRLCPSYPSETRSVFRTSIFVTFFFLLSTTVTNFFVILLQCDRFAFWEEETTTYCKLDSKTAQIAIGGIGVVTDILLWLMPLPVVWKLQLGKREKFLAVLTFGLGAVACIVSAFRLRAIQLYGYVSDGKVLSVNVNVLTVLELNLAIICASAPAIRALIIHYAPRILNGYSQAARKLSGATLRGEEKSADLDEEEERSTYTIQVGINVRGGPGDYPRSPGGGRMMGGDAEDVEKKSPGTGRSMRRLA
ncbi:hypothetical protein ABW20_dc0100241 [Dactylellina cionopaga]|nr:hypothetical protein ABW20_dc0100241 [Dactylellina cionopaga]